MGRAELSGSQPPVGAPRPPASAFRDPRPDAGSERGL